MENFVLYDELGRGEQRIVYKGRRKGTVNYFAIHCVDKTKREDLQNSVRITHSLTHKNIVQFYEWYETSNHLWLVLELCSGISLEAILSQDGSLPEETIRKFGRDVVEALYYLHSQNIIYCDLSPSKIILDGSGILKLGNFTLAKLEGELDDFDDGSSDLGFEFGQEEGLSRRLIRCLPFYVAPEVLQGAAYTKQSDLWSLGCLLFECFTGKPPYVATQFEELLSLIMSNEIPHPIQVKENGRLKATEEFLSLVKHLLVKDPSKRMSIEDICMHRFWNGELTHLLNSDESFSQTDSKYFENETRSSLIKHSSEDEGKESDVTVVQSFDSDGHEFGSPRDSIPDIKPPMKSRLGKGLAHLDLTSIGKNSLDSSIKVQLGKENYSQSRESKHRSGLYGSFERGIETKSHLVNEEDGDKDDIGMHVNLIDLLYHPSDLEVNPIIDNPKNNKQNYLKWDPHQISLPTIKPDQIQSMTRQDVDQHVEAITEAFKTLNQLTKGNDTQTNQKAKLHFLAYLCSLAKHEIFANSLLEKNITRQLITELKSLSSQEPKQRVGRLLGILACTATYISPNLKMAEVFSALTESIRENLCSPSLKIILLPALGEFMFYAATQEEGEDKRISNWDPPGASFTIITRCLQQGENVTVQHCAARIIENIATTAGRYCKKFLTKEVAHSLWNLFSHAVTDAEKLTAISALSRLSMHSNSMFQQVVERVGTEEILKTLFAGSSRVQQSLLTVLITLLPNQTHHKRIMQDCATVVGKMIRILETPSVVLRGKVYLFVAEIIGKSQNSLLECFQAKLVTYIERDSRKALSRGSTKIDTQAFLYLKQCLELAVSLALRQVPIIINGILKSLDAVSGRHHPPVASTKQLRAALPHLCIILHGVTSQVFRPRLIDDSFLESIGALLNYIKSIDSGEINISAALGPIRLDEVIRTTFSIVEAVSQHPLLLLQYRDTFAHAVLPPLGSFIQSSSGDSRILAMKLFSDICSLYLENDECAQSAREEAMDAFSSKLNKVISEVVLDRVDVVLQDQEPIPAYCLKLLHLFIDRNRAAGSLLVDNGLLIKTIELFETHQNDTRSSLLLAIVNVIASMVAAKSLDVASLCDQGLVEYLMSAFIAVSSVLEEDVAVDHASSLFIPLLDTLRHVLRGLEAGVKRAVRSRDEKRGPRELSHEVAKLEELLSTCRILSELNGVLITLLCFDDEDVQDWSCQCLYVSAELFGGEYEDSFSEDNLECLSDAIQMFDDKKRKLLLRVVKRLISSSSSLRSVLRENGTQLCAFLAGLTSTATAAAAATTADQKAVKNTASDILNMLKE